MLELLISILAVYFFVLIGFLLKRGQKEKIDDQSITLLSIYGLQPFLVFWGIMIKPLDADFFIAPLLYFGVGLILLFFLYLLAAKLFQDPKDRSIFAISPLIGNTGNLGIPLGIMLLGQESVFYTNAINLVNVFFVYIFGVFFYSLGNHSWRESLLNIFKMPVLWVAMFAILLNAQGVSFGEPVMQSLQMGAYASMVIQLLLFGIYLAGVQIKEINTKMLAWVSGVKFLVVPGVGLLVLMLVDLPPLVEAVLLLEWLVPLAVMNSVLANLYGCRPEVVTTNIFITSVIFIGVMFVAGSFMPLSG